MSVNRTRRRFDIFEAGRYDWQAAACRMRIQGQESRSPHHLSDTFDPRAASDRFFLDVCTHCPNDQALVGGREGELPPAKSGFLERELKPTVQNKTANRQRAAVYARYSTDEQRPQSIDDQIESCRRYCAAHGWTIVATYADSAISGSTAHRRQYQRLLADSERGVFDVVVVEALDRLSRRLSDVAFFHDRLAFRQIKLFAVDRGEITSLMVGVLGAMAQSYLDDLKGKTKRGLRGKILSGLSAGSLGFGYRPTAPRHGRLRPSSIPRTFLARKGGNGSIRPSVDRRIAEPELSTTPPTSANSNGTAVPISAIPRPAIGSPGLIHETNGRQAKTRTFAS